jgi:hypothetical protein
MEGTGRRLNVGVSASRLLIARQVKHIAVPAVLQVFTQVSLFLLLFGTMCGDFALLHDAALRAVSKLWLGAPPGIA